MGISEIKCGDAAANSLLLEQHFQHVAEVKGSCREVRKRLSFHAAFGTLSPCNWQTEEQFAQVFYSETPG